METFDVAILVLLFGSAIVISFVDAISAGGGLVTMPLAVVGRSGAGAGACHQQAAGRVRDRVLDLVPSPGRVRSTFGS